MSKYKIKDSVKDLQKLSIAHGHLLEELVKTLTYMDKKVAALEENITKLEEGLDGKKDSQ
jgi:cell division protein FtsB